MCYVNNIDHALMVGRTQSEQSFVVSIPDLPRQINH